MYCSVGYDTVDDDIPPPGFGPAGTERASQASVTASHTSANWHQLPTDIKPVHPGRHPPQTIHATSHSSGLGTNMGAGAARQFQKALFSSIADAKNPGASTKATAGCSPQHHQRSPEPDYGIYNDDDCDYGSSRMPGSRQTGRHQAGTTLDLDHRHSSAVRGTTSSRSNPSISPVRRQLHGARPGSSTQSPGRPASQQQSQRSTPARSPTPDYGMYGDSDDYGSDSRGSSSRRNTRMPGNGRRQAATAAAIAAAADESTVASVAATQALLGVSGKVSHLKLNRPG